MINFVPILFFLFGASIGSFVNVIVKRLHVAPVLTGRSKCLSCGKTLAWYDLIPIFSYIHHGGKCRHCKSHIGKDNLIVEIIYGIIFVLFYNIFLIPHGLVIESLYWSMFYTIFFVVIGVVALYDIKHKVIPSLFLFLFLILSFVMMYIRYIDDTNIYILLEPLAVAFPFLILFLVSRGRWLGFGDVLMFIGVGAIFPLSSGIAVLLISIWMGAIYGILILITRKTKFGNKTEMPFIPFIVLAILIVMFTDTDMNTISNLLSHVII